MGLGEIVSRPYRAVHWHSKRAREGATAQFVDIDILALANEASKATIPRDRLALPPFSPAHRSSQTSGISIPDHVFEAVVQEWNQFSDQKVSGRISSSKGQSHYSEGRQRNVKLTQYERNKAARQACIEHYGSSCVVCGFNFESTYGSTVRMVLDLYTYTI